MNFVPSQSSLHPGGTGDQHASIGSLFESVLPQRTTQLEVKLPRGLRAHGSPRIAAGCLHSVPTKAYTVIVEPRAHRVGPKEALRLQALRAGASDEPVSDDDEERPWTEVDERLQFRRERLKHFEMRTHFPALVSPRLVPGWKEVAGQVAGDAVQADPLRPLKDAPLMTAAASTRSQAPARRKGPRLSQLTRPTASQMHMKREKHEAVNGVYWRTTGVAGIYRAPGLFQDVYRDPRVELRSTTLADKEAWMAESTMLPVGNVAGKVTFDSNQPHLQSHIAAMRERGRAYNDSLKERYEQSREAWSRGREQLIMDRGGLLSSFDQLLVREQLEAEERERNKPKEEPKGPEKPRFSMFSMHAVTSSKRMTLSKSTRGSMFRARKSTKSLASLQEALSAGQA